MRASGWCHSLESCGTTFRAGDGLTPPPRAPPRRNKKPTFSKSVLNRVNADVDNNDVGDDNNNNDDDGDGDS